MKDPVTNKDRKRLVIIAIVIFFLFSILIAQFFRIQIIEGDKWTRVANRQHFFTVKEPFHRGTFISNTSIKRGHPELKESFVIDVQKYHLYVDPDSIPEKRHDEIAKILVSKLDLTVDEKMAFRKQFDYKSRSRKLAMWLDSDIRQNVLDWWRGYSTKYKIPGNAIFFVSDYQRSYPFGKLLGQVLHTIQGNKDETTQQAIPTGGLELYFNRYLQGTIGKRRLMRSPRNSLETGEVVIKPQNGADVYLTINHILQAIAEEEIARGVLACKAKSGWAVMMEPKTGYILALAQYPFFNPGDYQRFFNDGKLIDNTRVKAVTDANEPASVMKPITLATALLANEALKNKGQRVLFSPDEKVDTSSSSFPGRSKPLTDTHFHHFLNMNMALQKSSNIYMARLVERIISRLGKEWYRDVLCSTFGFGEKTNIELPGESRGVLPLPGKKNSNGTFEWSTPTPFSMAMGHNIQITSMQLLRAYAIFANGGYLVQPTMVRKVVKTAVDGKQETLVDHTTEQWLRSRRVLSQDIVTQIVEAMKYVTKPGGTARKGDIWGFTEAGKTGTSKKIINGTYSNTLYWANFVGFTPVKDPAFVLLIGVDEPEYGYIPGIGKNHNGGTCAAPIFRAIATRTLEYLGIAPDDPHGYPSVDPRYDGDKADWIAETRQLQEMYEKWNKNSQ